MRANRKIFGTLQGFTLVEVMVVLVILSILTIFVAPELTSWKPKMRLKNAADTLFENMQMAKSYAIKNNISVVFSFTLGAPLGLTSCKGGSYSFTDTAANVVANVAMTNNVCLKASGFDPLGTDGFTSRALPINTAVATKTVTLSTSDLPNSGDPTYLITQAIGGGITLTKGTNP